MAWNMVSVWSPIIGFATVSLFTPLARAEDSTTVHASESAALAPGLQLSLKLEPGVALAITEPQSRGDVGMGGTAKILVGVTPFLQLGPTFGFATLPDSGALMADSSGRSFAFGAGGRLMRPHDAGRYGISPWLDADLLYVRTGTLDRPGFSAAVGVSMPLDQQRRFWLGPFVRYFQIVQGDRDGFDNRDAKVLTFGFGLEVTTGLAKPTRVAVAEPLPVEPVEPAPPSDRDGDGVLDDADNCPDVAGLAENAGCPPKPVVILKPDKLEVQDHIVFEWNSAVLDASSHAALDEVARVLQANRNFRVRIEGHASSDGGEVRNQTLSEQRAAAVLAYLVTKGVASDRLISKGLSSSDPNDTNTTVAGRESNRRVEFIVNFIIVPEANTP
jgi:outer membrane protein OmpA-like peptidoglycan-associated protein